MFAPSLKDQSFRYVPAVETNVAETFARVRAQMAAGAQAHGERRVEPPKRPATKGRGIGTDGATSSNAAPAATHERQEEAR